MSAEPVEPGPLYHSPIGLFGFQVDGVAHTYWRWSEAEINPVILALWDTGIGKTHLAMASLAFAFEDDLIDQAVVVVEANKMLDWSQNDLPTFTDLTVAQHRGDVKKRQKILADPPQVLVMSYEMGRNDICQFRGPKSHAVVGDKMLSEALRGKRVAIVFDEFSRLRNRSSKTYIAWDYLINRVLRKTRHEPRLLGLTATSVEKHPADHWNAGRLLAPNLAGSVAAFEENYVATRSVHDNSPASWKNLTAEDPFRDPSVLPLNQMFASITLRKRKTDPDVIDFFPAKMENPPTMVDLGDQHRALYDSVEEIFADETLDDATARQGFGLLRQIVNHPMSLLRSRGQFAQQIVASTGAAYLEGLAVAKVEAMLEWQRLMEDQQTVIFTFYGNSVLPYLQHALGVEGYKVSVNHGSMSLTDRQRSQEAFKAGDTQIFLSSDAGAKGLNLGVGSGLLHYEAPALWATYDQRSNRIHRIDSKHPSVTIDCLVARDTLEEPVAMKMLTRAEWAEAIQDPDLIEDFDPSERFLRAKDRIEMFKRAKR